MNFFLTAFLLFFLPFLIFPVGTSYFETAKVVVGEISIGLLMVQFLWHHDVIKIISRKHLPLILLFCLALCQLLLGTTMQSFFGNAFRLQGAFFFLYLLLLATTSSQQKNFHIAPLVPLATLGGLVLSLFLFGTNQAGRFIGPFGEPNALAAAALFLWPWIVYSQQKNHKKIYISLSLLSAGMILFAAGSQSADIGFLLQGLFILLQKRGISLRESAIICFSLLLCTLLLPFLTPQSIYENRADIWRIAFAAGFTHPLFGNGIGAITTALHAAAFRMGNLMQYQHVDSSHNILLDFWVQTGFFGLTLFLSLLCIVVKTFVVNNRQKELLLLLGLLTSLLFNPMSSAILIMFWWTLGQGLQTKLQES